PVLTIRATMEFFGTERELTNETRSVIGAIRSLHGSGNDFVAGLILLFSRCGSRRRRRRPHHGAHLAAPTSPPASPRPHRGARIAAPAGPDTQGTVMWPNQPTPNPDEPDDPLSGESSG
ncbi:MAG: hypothetical protein ACK6DP_14525, partial [Gemmatimonas sp.]|uniref:hypothetical protein n=1 Tax=Gemmatimonas sp. TaxID=1962908 RepID=UPI00391F5FBA